MKSEKLARVLAILIVSLSFSFQLAGQDQPVPKHHCYKVVILGPLGGPTSGVGGKNNGLVTLNNLGEVVVAGDTPVPDPFNPGFAISHLYSWLNGFQVDFQVLPVQPGSAGNNAYPNWLSDSGLVAGWSATGVIDPITQNPEINAALWTPDGRIIDLGTLGGYQSSATAVNNFGLVTGWVENTTPDPFSFGEGTQTQAYLWQFGVMHPLGTLGGPDSNAFAVNDLGQAAGCSLTSATPNASTGFPPYDAFIWENGKMIDLHPGDFGGAAGCANYLTDRGQVVGFMTTAEEYAHPFLWNHGEIVDLFTVGNLGGDYGSAYVANDQGHVGGFASLPGDVALHGVLWRNGTSTDIQTVDGDPCSLVYDINSSDQIVGTSASCDFSTVLHAFLWENGDIVDLNTLIPPDSGIQLQFAYMINDNGVIAGNGVLTDNPAAFRAFLLFPQDNNDQSNAADVAASVPKPNVQATSRVPQTPGAIAPWAKAHAASHRIFFNSQH
jgi:probable HAF family extracellular repeat protein